MEVLLTLFIMSHIVCISATLYGAVETLQVNESMSRQLIKTVGRNGLITDTATQ
jgi:hypothetical protein